MRPPSLLLRQSDPPFQLFLPEVEWAASRPRPPRLGRLDNEATRHGPDRTMIPIWIQPGGQRTGNILRGSPVPIIRREKRARLARLSFSVKSPLSGHLPAGCASRLWTLSVHGSSRRLFLLLSQSYHFFSKARSIAPVAHTKARCPVHLWQAVRHYVAAMKHHRTSLGETLWRRGYR